MQNTYIFQYDDILWALAGFNPKLYVNRLLNPKKLQYDGISYEHHAASFDEN